MGTTIEMKVIGLEEADANRAMAEALQEVERINQKYSTYIEDSYLSQINAKSDTIEIDKETYTLFEKCDKVYKLTSGAFDPAVGNLIDLLGFESGEPHLPDTAATDSVLKSVGWKHIKLLGNGKIIKKTGIKINLGGIAKGYAVDKAAVKLIENAATTYLINFGGEVKGAGHSWTIGVQHPRKRDRLLGEFTLDSVGVATSGDYEQYFEKDEKRYSHIINPASGKPAEGVQSVSVFHENLAIADALATGVFVMGIDKGLKLIESIEGAECLIVDSNGNTHQTKNVDKFFRRR